jgi:hypothetical protein
LTIIETFTILRHQVQLPGSNALLVAAHRPRSPASRTGTVHALNTLLKAPSSTLKAVPSSRSAFVLTMPGRVWKKVIPAFF